jgi:hypothetical protein
MTEKEEYLITSNSGRQKMEIRAPSEMAAAARFILETGKDKAVIKEANEFGDKTIDRSMNSIREILEDVRVRNIETDIVD